MNTSKRWSRLAARGLVVVLTGLGVWSVSAAVVESNLEKSFRVGPRPRFSLDSDRGPVELRVGEAAEIQVKVQREVSNATAAQAREILAAHEVSFDQDGSGVSVRARLNREEKLGGRRQPQLKVRFIVTVPPASDLDVKTAAGSIKGGNHAGEVRARTAGGDIEFGEIRGRFDAVTAAGSIRCAGAGGAVTAKTSGGELRLGRLEADASLETSAGSIHVKHVGGKLRARTAGGNIETGELLGPATLETSAGSITVGTAHARLEARTSGGELNLEDVRDVVVGSTSAGSIKAAFTAQPEGGSRLTTSGGNLEVRLDPELAFDLDASTRAGRVTTELPVVATVVGEHRTEALQGKINGGGPALVLKTSAGNIHLRKR